MKLTEQELLAIAKLLNPKKKFEIQTIKNEVHELVYKRGKINYELLQIDTKSKTIYIAESIEGKIRNISFIPIYNLVIEYIKANRAANLLMEYWDSIPDDEKELLSKKLNKLGF